MVFAKFYAGINRITRKQVGFFPILVYDIYQNVSDWYSFQEREKVTFPLSIPPFTLGLMVYEVLGLTHFPLSRSRMYGQRYFLQEKFKWQYIYIYKPNIGIQLGKERG